MPHNEKEVLKMNKDKELLIKAYEDYEKSGRDFEYWMFDRTANLAEATIFCKYNCDTYTELLLLVNAEDLEILILISRLRTLVKFSDRLTIRKDVEKSFYKYKEKVEK
jgi:hypothetical protein